MIKRPLLGMVVSMIVGMLLHDLKIGYVIGICAGLCLLLCNNKKEQTRNLRRQLHLEFTKEDWHRYLWPVFLFVGFLCFNRALEVEDIEQALVSQREGSLRGEVVDIKKTNKATSILINHAIIRFSGTQDRYDTNKVVVYLTEEADLAIGYQVNLTGEFSSLSKATNPGQFDEYSYYRSQGVSCKMYAKSLEITLAKKALIFDWL